MNIITVYHFGEAIPLASININFAKLITWHGCNSITQWRVHRRVICCHFNGNRPSKHRPCYCWNCTPVCRFMITVYMYLKQPSHLYSKYSLCPRDTIWRHRSVSTLAPVLAWCLMAPSHYMNQSWLIISKVQWHSSEDIFLKKYARHQSLKLVWKLLL